MYTTAAMAEQSGYGAVDGYAFTQYVQTPTVLTTAGQTYLSTVPNTVLSPYNMASYPTPISDLTYADLSMMSSKKLPYTTATLGRPNRQPLMKIQEPTIYAQVRISGIAYQIFLLFVTFINRSTWQSISPRIKLILLPILEPCYESPLHMQEPDLLITKCHRFFPKEEFKTDLQQW